VHGKYGEIGDKELTEAIDRMTFHNVETEILVTPKTTDPMAVFVYHRGRNRNKIVFSFCPKRLSSCSPKESQTPESSVRVRLRAIIYFKQPPV
jgi:hypothetical protein